MIEKVSNGDAATRRILDRSPRGVSVVLDPTGAVLGPALSDQEGILYAEIDTALSVEPTQFHDVVGYYNRFDIFDFRVDRTAREPATFRDRGPSMQASLADETSVTADQVGNDGSPGAPDVITAGRQRG